MKPEPGPNTTQGQEERFRCGPVRSGCRYVRPRTGRKFGRDRIRRIPRLGYRHSAVAADRSGDRNPCGTGSTYSSAKFDLDTDMARAYIDGFQTSVGAAEIADGWGMKASMPWSTLPGGGPEEGGRDAHFQLREIHCLPRRKFRATHPALCGRSSRLNGKTRKAAAVMPYYTASTGDPGKKGRQRFCSKYICHRSAAEQIRIQRRRLHGIGASRTTIPASRRLTANAGEWRH